MPATCPFPLRAAHSVGRGTFAKMGTFVPRGMVFIYSNRKPIIDVL